MDVYKEVGEGLGMRGRRRSEQSQNIRYAACRMWFLLSLIAAVIYSSLWLFARGSRGLPSAVVTSASSIWGPFFLLASLPFVNFPWGEPWWYLYLLMPFCVLPLAIWLLTLSSQRTDVGIIKPLSGLSSIAALFMATVVFGQVFPPAKIFGIIIITTGLFLIYHNRWSAWRTPWPWVVLVCVTIMGINSAIVVEMLTRFPHPVVLSSLSATGACVLIGIGSGKRWRTVRFDSRTLRFLGAYAAAVAVQDILTFLALEMAPAAYVIAVKRTSILFAALGGYLIFHEHELTLKRLVLSSSVVIVGVAMLNLA